MRKWKFHLATFGCKINQYESQRIREAWLELGGVETNAPEEADYICVNSCAITANAERDARNAVYKLKAAAPKAKIIATGCAAQFFEDFRPLKNGKKLLVDFVIPQKTKKELLNGPPPFHSPDTVFQGANKINSFFRARPVIKIQDGCSQNCAYCVIPQTRGKPFSRDGREILAECESLLANGYAELILSGINLRQYGSHDQDYPDFWGLTEFLLKNLKGSTTSFRFRISSLDPALLTDKALELFINYKELCPHLHLSLQHASPEILRQMGRGHYQPLEVLNKTRELRKNRQLAIGADILVGFPGETEADMRMLEDYCQEMDFSYAHIFPYSPRPHTIAAKKPGQLFARLKKERCARIREAIRKSQKKFLQEQLAREECFFVADLANQANGKGKIKGVNEFYVNCELERQPELPQKNSITRVKPTGLRETTLLVSYLPFGLV